MPDIRPRDRPGHVCQPVPFWSFNTSGKLLRDQLFPVEITTKDSQHAYGIAQALFTETDAALGDETTDYWDRQGM
jgi:hypothetical protein